MAQGCVGFVNLIAANCWDRADKQIIFWFGSVALDDADVHAEADSSDKRVLQEMVEP